MASTQTQAEALAAARGAPQPSAAVSLVPAADRTAPGGRIDAGRRRQRVEQRDDGALAHLGGVDVGRIGRRIARCPGAKPAHPAIERTGRIALGLAGFGPAQPGVDEISGHIVERRMGVGIDERGGDLMAPQQRDEGRHDEARVAHLDDVAQRAVAV